MSYLSLYFWDSQNICFKNIYKEQAPVLCMYLKKNLFLFAYWYFSEQNYQYPKLNKYDFGLWEHTENM